jgi:hypothetical protein
VPEAKGRLKNAPFVTVPTFSIFPEWVVRCGNFQYIDTWRRWFVAGKVVRTISRAASDDTV